MTVSSTETAGPPVDTNSDVTSDSSTETEVKGVGSMLDAVNSALGETEPEAPPAPTEQDSKEPDPNSKSADAKPVETELSEEELAKYSKGAQRRIRELVEVKKTVEAEAQTIRQEVEALKPKAERVDQLDGFMREHRIAPDHLNNALGLTAMINGGRYTEALPILENLVNQVKAAAGEVLPADLQQQVNLGYITEAHAKTLRKAQLSEHRARETAEAERTKVENERKQREVDTIVTTATTAADKWSQEQQTSDPDWNLKRDLVTVQMENELHRLKADGYPRTEKAVRDLLDKVKKDVEAQIGRFRPPPKAISNVSGGAPSPRSAAKPATMLDAIEQGLANAHRG